MRYVLSLIIVAFLAIIACSGQQATVSQTDYNKLQAEVYYLQNDMENIRGYVQTDPGYFLYLMDLELEATKKGDEARGSFTDYFVPTAGRALTAGASKEDIDSRIDQVISLAKEGKYLSGFVATNMQDNHPEYIRQYAYEWLGLEIEIE